MNLVLSAPLTHKVGHVKHYFIIRWKWYKCDQIQAGSKGTSKSHAEVAQVPLVPSPGSLPSPPASTCVLVGVP